MAVCDCNPVMRKWTHEDPWSLPASGLCLLGESMGNLVTKARRTVPEEHPRVTCGTQGSLVPYPLSPKTEQESTDVSTTESLDCKSVQRPASKLHSTQKTGPKGAQVPSTGKRGSRSCHSAQGHTLVTSFQSKLPPGVELSCSELPVECPVD